MSLSTSPGEPPVKAGWKSVRALLPGFLLANLEGSLVNVALPEIQRDLGLQLSWLGWVAMACLLPTAALCPLMGVVADRAGRRRVYLLGLVLVGLGSVVAAVAPGFAVLLAARAIQGVGCAALIANGLAIVTEQFEAHERGRALGFMTAVVGLGAILSPVLGGALSAWVGWRGVFVVTALPVVPGSRWVIDRIPADAPIPAGWWRGIPWGRAALLAASVSSTILAVWGGGRWGWGSPLVGGSVGIALVAGVALLRPSSVGRLPLLEVHALPARTRWSLVALGLGSVGLAAGGFVLPLYLAAERGLEGLELGLRICPFPLGLVLGAVAGGRWGDRRGTRGPVLAGLVLFGAGMGLFSIGGLPALALAGLGLGTFSVGNNAEVVHGQRERVGSLTGLVGLIRLSGQVLGVALAGAVLARLGTGVGVGWIVWVVVPALAAAWWAYREPGDHGLQESRAGGPPAA